MKHKFKKIKGTYCQLEVEIPQETVEEVLNAIFDEYKKKAEIKGFRKGKVPLDIVKSIYKEEAIEKTKQEIISKKYMEAIEENNLDPISYPEVKDIELDNVKGLKFKAFFDIYPEITLYKYMGLKVTKEIVKVEEKEIEEVLTRFRNIHAKYEDIERQLEKGDVAVCDVEMFIEEKIVGKKRENLWIEVNKEASFFGLGEELIGLNKKDKKQLKMILPKDYADKEYANKEAVFSVEIKEVKEKKLPELNEEFAKTLGKNNIDEVKKDIKESLKHKKEEDEVMKMADQIVVQLLENHNFILPESMVKRQLDFLVNEEKEKLLKKGIKEEEIEIKQLEDKLLKQAQEKVKLYFIINEIGEKEGINIEETDINKRFEDLARYYNQSVDKVKQYYEENNLISGMVEKIKEEKVLAFVFNKAEKKEIQK